jgi:PAS domain S-box-containing protein
MIEPIPFHTSPRDASTRHLMNYEHSYRSLCELISEALLICDLKGICVDYNQRAAELFNSPARSLIGMSIFQMVPENEREELRHSFAKLQLISGIRVTNKKHIILAYDGRRVPVEMTIGLVCDVDGRAFQFQCLLHNSTERRSILHQSEPEATPDPFIKEINGMLDLDTMLDLILDHVHTLVPYDRADILLLDDLNGSEKIWLAQRRGCRQTERRSLAGERILLTLADAPFLYHILQTQNPLQIKEDASHLLGPHFYHPNLNDYIAVPICGPTHTVGFIVLSSSTPCYQDVDIEQLYGLASRVEKAISNALFVQQTQQLATLEERQRLARELHDAVSQTLFSANIFVEMMPRIFERKPDEVGKHFQQLRRLVRGALGEMRSLLHELRPDSLVVADLATLLGYLVDAAGARTDTQISLSIGNIPMLPTDDKIAFYRITQEALNNAIKHAHATHVSISLKVVGDELQLRVVDNGVGFEREQLNKGQLGMDIIRERAAAIGATLDLQGAPGQGVQVTLHYRVPSTTEEVDDDE